MAPFGRAHLGKPAINEFIQREVLPHGNIEVIKEKRRHTSYKNLLEEGNFSGSDVEPPVPPPMSRRAGRRTRAPS